MGCMEVDLASTGGPLNYQFSRNGLPLIKELEGIQTLDIPLGGMGWNAINGERHEADLDRSRFMAVLVQ